MSIFLDFDGTITTEDTITHLANFALRLQSERNGSPSNLNSSAHPASQITDSSSPQSQPQPQSSSQSPVPAPAPVPTPETTPLKSRWDAVVASYLSDHRSHASSYAPAPAQRTTAAAEIAFQRSQKPVETASLARVRDCGLFRGIGPDEFRGAGRALVGGAAVGDAGREGGRHGEGVGGGEDEFKGWGKVNGEGKGNDAGEGEGEGEGEGQGGPAARVRLRPGFAAFVRARLDEGWRVAVVSVNWSAAFIQGACGFERDEVAVYANEVRAVDGAVVGPAVLRGAGGTGDGVHGEEDGKAGEGEGCGVLTNSADKLRVFRAVMRENEEDGGRQGGPTIYFGDSTTDLECLLAAGRGVVMADDEASSSLIQTLRRIGRRVPHVRDAREEDEVVWASDYEEVMAGMRFCRV